MGKNYKKFIKIEFFVLLFSIFYFLFSASALAQFELPSLNIRPTLRLSANPITPAPNSMVAVTADVSGITNVSNSTYTWFLNGARQNDASGLNKNTFIFPAGTLGTTYRTSVTVLSPAGDNLSDSVSFTVSDMDITWNANNYVPADYEGKILPTQNSIISASVLPFVYRPGTKTIIGSASLTYNWMVDEKFLTEKSGVNKTDYVFRINNFAGATKSIRVEVRNDDKSISLTKEIKIPVVRPQTLIYFYDVATTRPFGSALREFAAKTVDPLNFMARNYFFNTTPNRIKWSWTIDGVDVAGAPDFPWLAIFSVPKNILRPFSSQARLTAQNPDYELETAATAVNFEIR